MASAGSEDQITQPPNGSCCGTPSRVTRVRPAPEPTMPRSDTPWVVGFAPKLEVRRNVERLGTCLSATSKRLNGAICASPRRTAENAGSPRAGGSRAASIMTVSMAGGWSTAAAMDAPANGLVCHDLPPDFVGPHALLCPRAVVAGD